MDAVAPLAERADGLNGALAAGRRSFCDFDCQAGGWNGCLFQYLIEHGKKRWIDQIGCRNVNAETEAGLIAKSLPEFADGVPQHQLGDLSDETALFGDPDEHVRADWSSVFGRPAHERFSTYDALRFQIDQRLVHQAQLVSANCAAKLLLNTFVAPVKKR